MKSELDRIKNDLQTMQKALGLAPSVGRDWLQWMKRDQWLGLWWCIPGVVLIAAGLIPANPGVRFLELAPAQWAGLATALVILGISIVHSRKITTRDGRPDGLVRESKRLYGMTAEGVWFCVALVAELAVYFIWAKEYRIAFEPFWAGLFILSGSSCLAAALAARVWTLLGWAIPFLGYGLCLPLVGGHGKMNSVLFGAMFLAVALCFSLIASLQIRFLERQDDTH